MKKIALLILVLGLTACLPSNQNEGLPPELLNKAVDALEKEVETPLETPEQIPEEPQTVIELESNQENESGRCQVLAKGLVEAFEDINYCEQDSDCQVEAGVCPFGCYYLYNDALDFTSYERDIRNYKAECKPCEYECEAIGDLKAPKCIDNKCILPQ